MGGLRGAEFLVLGALLGGPAAIALVVVLAVTLGRRRSPAPAEAAEAARRHGGWVHLGAWAASFLAPLASLAAVPAVVAALPDGDDATAVLVALVVVLPALVYLGVHALGERVWPRPTGPVRRAALVPRRSPAPRWLAGVATGWAAATIAVLLVTALTATDGSHLVRGSNVAMGYPGWRFGLCVLVAVAGVGLGTWATLRLVARRPAVTGDDAFDAASRRLTAHRVLRGVQLAFAATLATVLAFTATALSDVGLGGLGGALRAGAALVTLAGVVIAVLPARAAVPGSWAPPTPVAPPTPIGPATPAAPATPVGPQDSTP